MAESSITREICIQKEGKLLWRYEDHMKVDFEEGRYCLSKKIFCVRHNLRGNLKEGKNCSFNKISGIENLVPFSCLKYSLVLL